MHLNGREFEKICFYKLLNFAPRWDLAWFDKAAGKDFNSLIKSLGIMDKFSSIVRVRFSVVVHDLPEWLN